MFKGRRWLFTIAGMAIFALFAAVMLTGCPEEPAFEPIDEVEPAPYDVEPAPVEPAPVEPDPEPEEVPEEGEDEAMDMPEPEELPVPEE